MRAGEPEELSKYRQPLPPGAGQLGKEGFNVVDVGQGPVVFAAVALQEAGEVTHGGQRSLDGDVGARTGPGSAGAFTGLEHHLLESDDGVSQRCWCCHDSALPTTGSQAFALVGRDCHGMFGEEFLQGASQGSHRAAGPAGALEQCLRVLGQAVVQEAAKSGDHDAGAAHTIAGTQMCCEVRQPGRWLV